MSEIFFSIIIPTYNRADLLPKTLQSLLNQTYSHYEIIVVDDGSTDNTSEIMKEWISEKVIYFPKINEERAVARNTGARLAKGEYLNFFDSDDIAYPNHLQVAANFINEINNPEIFHLGHDYKTPEGDIIREVNNFTSENLNEELIQGNILSCNGVFIKKEIALKHPFNEDRQLSASEDWELWLRLAAIYPIKYNNTITSTIVNHEMRSVLVINKEKLIKRQEAFIKHLFDDKAAKEKYNSYKNLFISDCYTYISLHLALTKNYKKDVIIYIWKAFAKRPAVLSRKRFWASLKHLI